jgi:hypothetical protein
MATQNIYQSNGAVEYTWPLTITELQGEDISADTIQLALGTDTVPGAWKDPDTDDQGDSNSQRVVRLLIGALYQPAPGTYHLWWKIGDAPETPIRISTHIVQVI